MIEKVISALAALLAAAALVWWFDDNIKAHYQRPLIEAHEKQIEAQKVAHQLALGALAVAKANIKTVYVDRLKTIEVYAETLAPNTACLADSDFVRVYNNSSKR